MIDGLSLLVYSNDRADLVADFSTLAQGWRQEKTEGPYRASFELTAGKDGADGTLFEGWQKSLLGCYVEARFGGMPCWGGYIRETRHQGKKASSVLSIRDLANNVRAKYRDEYSGKDRYTEWATDWASVEMFGLSEKTIDYDGKASAQLNDDGSIKLRDPADPSSRYTEVHAAVDAELARMAWPQMADLSFDDSATESISFELDGMTTLADGTMVADASVAGKKVGELRPAGYEYDEGFVVGSETTVGDEIRRLLAVSNHHGWLHAVKVDDNDTLTSAGVQSSMGLWTRILQLARLRNQAGELYRLAVDETGGVVYELMEMEPDYLYFPQRGIVRMDGELPTWTARPGIAQLTSGLPTPGTHMPRPDFVYMERVTMAEGYDYAVLSLRNETPEDMRRDLAANITRLEKHRDMVK
jgi:hypothetical protein